MADKISRREALASLAKGSVVVAGVVSASAFGETRASSAKGEPTLFDVHQHLESSDSNFSDFEIAAVITKDFTARSRSMDENGIEKSVIFPSNDYRKTNGIESTRKVNDLMAA